MKLKSLATSIATAILLSACGSSNDSTGGNSTLEDAIAAKYQGNWQAPGYALSIEIGTDSVNVYRYTSDYCLHITEEIDVNTQDLERLVREADEAQQLEWYSGFGSADSQVPGIHFDQVVELPESCQGNVISMLDGTTTTLDILELWDLYGQIFSEYYVDFDLNSVDWNQVLNDAGSELHSGSDAFSLFLAMEQTLVPLSDGHNYVQAQQGWSAKTLTKPTLIERLIEEFADANDLPYPIPDHLVTQDLVDDANAYIMAHLENQWELVADYAEDPSDIQTAANGHIRWFENQGLGYLFIGSMAGYADPDDYDELDYAEKTLSVVNAALNQALTDLQHVNGLIIDVRTNDGGHDFVSLAIANRFTDSAVHAYSKQARTGNSRTPLLDVYLEPHSGIRFTEPTVLLTSSSTVSAAEAFTLSMAQLPQVTLIGERSHGAFSDVMEWDLPNGFKAGLSNEYYLSPQGEWFEGQGVPVDAFVPFYTIEQREAEVDLGIETAFEILTN